MQPSDGSSGGAAAAGAAGVHRHFLWLLLACYLLAAVMPKPGVALRQLSIPRSGGHDITAPLVMLAVLLFCGALSVRFTQVRELLQRPTVLFVAVATAWLGGATFASLMGLAVPLLVGETLAAGTMLGLALVAAMPVANSSVGWSQHSDGNVALSLGLVVLTILLSPVVTPQLLRYMGLLLSEQETAQCEILVTRFSGTFFIVWVILPALSGMAIAWLAGPRQIARAKPWIRIVSGLNLLLLNYVNASLAMPGIVSSASIWTVVVPVVLAAALCLVGILLAWVVTRLMSLPSSSWIALNFGFSMKHTGLALVLAGTVLGDEPKAIFMIIVATLAQHVMAGAADWYLHRFGNLLERYA